MKDFIQALSEIYIDTFPLLTLIKSYMKSSSPPPPTPLSTNDSTTPP